MKATLSEGRACSADISACSLESATERDHERCDRHRGYDINGIFIFGDVGRVGAFEEVLDDAGISAANSFSVMAYCGALPEKIDSPQRQWLPSRRVAAKFSKVSARYTLPSPAPKEIGCVLSEIMLYSPHPVPLRGRFAIVTDVGCGMRWAHWVAARACSRGRTIPVRR
jgi:hypothetical protein